MRIIISTHQGNLYNDEIDSLVVHADNTGEFGILENHVPVITVMADGWVKLVRDADEFYVVIVGGILEFHDNVATILVQEAQIGRTLDSAKEHLAAIRHERLEKNRKEVVDFTEAEKDLHENIKKANAGSL